MTTARSHQGTHTDCLGLKDAGLVIRSTPHQLRVAFILPPSVYAISSMSRDVLGYAMHIDGLRIAALMCQ